MNHEVFRDEITFFTHGTIWCFLHCEVSRSKKLFSFLCSPVTVLSLSLIYKALLNSTSRVESIIAVLYRSLAVKGNSTKKQGNILKDNGPF